MAKSSSSAVPGDVEWLPGPGGSRVLRIHPASPEPPALILRTAGGAEVRVEARPGPATEYDIPSELDWSTAWLQWPDGTRATVPAPHGPHAQVIELRPRRERAAAGDTPTVGAIAAGSEAATETAARDETRAGGVAAVSRGTSSVGESAARDEALSGGAAAVSRGTTSVGESTARDETPAAGASAAHRGATSAGEAAAPFAGATADAAAHWTTPPRVSAPAGADAEALWRSRTADLGRELADAAAAIARAREGERSARDAVLAALAAARADLRASRAARAADASTLAAVTGELDAERSAHAVTRGSVGTLADALAATRTELAAEKSTGDSALAGARAEAASLREALESERAARAATEALLRESVEARSAAETALRESEARTLAETALRESIEARAAAEAALRAAESGSKAEAARLAPAAEVVPGEAARLAPAAEAASNDAARLAPAAEAASNDAARLAPTAEAAPHDAARHAAAAPHDAARHAAAAPHDAARHVPAAEAASNDAGRLAPAAQATPRQAARSAALARSAAALAAGDAGAAGDPPDRVSLMDRVADLNRQAAGLRDQAELERRAREQTEAAAAVAPRAQEESAKLLANLDAAAAALRASAPPAEEPDQATSATALVALDEHARLRHALLAFAREDPTAAGTLLVGLVPAQGAVLEGSLSYDLTVRGVGTFAVTVEDGSARVVRLSRKRPRGEALFHLSGEPVALAELLAGERHKVGRLRRKARLTGNRKRAQELMALPAASISLAQAARAGARLEPALVYRALPFAIDPEWTRGHNFTVAQQIVELAPQAWHITVRDGQPVRVVERNTGAQADATVTMSRAAFDRLLRAERPVHGDHPVVRGDREAVAALKRWTERLT